MPLQLKSGGLASNFAFFAYVYIVIIFSLFQVNRHPTELRVNLYMKYIINNEKKKKRVRKNISLPLGPRFGI